MNREQILAFVRLVLMILASVNSLLLAKGIHPIPFDENVVMENAAHAIDALIILYGWWKDNNVTKKANNKKAIIDKVLSGMAILVDVMPADEPEEIEELEAEYAEVE